MGQDEVAAAPNTDKGHARADNEEAAKEPNTSSYNSLSSTGDTITSYGRHRELTSTRLVIL